MPYRIFTLLLFSTFLSQASRSQSMAACPPNIGFENGNFLNWQTNLGRVSLSGSTNVITFSSASWLEGGNTTGRQDLMDRNANPAPDPYGNFPVNPANGGRYALKLGNDGNVGTCNNAPCPDARAEAARYVVQVPANATDYSITFSYAVVLENPQDNQDNRHRDEEQPGSGSACTTR